MEDSIYVNGLPWQKVLFLKNNFNCSKYPAYIIFKRLFLKDFKSCCKHDTVFSSVILWCLDQWEKLSFWYFTWNIQYVFSCTAILTEVLPHNSTISNEDTNTTHWEMLQSLRDWCHQQNHSPSHMIITETQQSPGIPSVPTASGQSQYWASSSDHSIWRMLSQYEELSQIIF